MVGAHDHPCTTLPCRSTRQAPRPFFYPPFLSGSFPAGPQCHLIWDHIPAPVPQLSCDRMLSGDPPIHCFILVRAGIGRSSSDRKTLSSDTTLSPTRFPSSTPATRLEKPQPPPVSVFVLHISPAHSRIPWWWGGRWRSRSRRDEEQAVHLVVVVAVAEVGVEVKKG